MDPRFLWLFAGVGGILLVASIIGAILSRTVKSEGGRETVRNLNERVRAWWVMVAIFGIAFVFGKVVTLVLFGLTSFYCLREFISLTPTRPADHGALAIAFYIFLPLQYYLIGIDWLALFSIAIPVYAFLLLPVAAAVRGETADFLMRTAKIQWALMLTVYCISHAPALLILNIPGYEGQNFLLLFFLVTVVQLSDVLQYVFGKLFGRHKVAPRVSPAKTWEGLIGGGLSAIAVGAGLWWITPFTPLEAAGMAAAIVIAGFCGGIVLSAVKRSLGAKDWGTMIEGHGGALDRMDSVSFAAPLFFHLCNYFFAA
ncbi:phosphatidate cytidylyltransferase [Parasphingopyxis marina]|uniref:Phosphatidate cytidylyltransferase n=1 Tax=Parasphingopyxis marina TaxID=2761622 RepID=A0A842HZT8_9SPHN|nr:phosphatidate cytidylyltransferase [Parasphingopyxis marina]MBC2778716.1 phosphatidate cytidylyltransferase [Parasphingopyxis marina]